MTTGTIGTETLTGLLRQDHQRMRKLFRDFERRSGSERESVVSEALSLIQTHDVVEQALLYPAVAKERNIPRALVLRCEEAHHVVHLIMAELKVKPYSERYFAKFSNLADVILEHIEEEENELFPEIERSDIDNEGLGRRMVELRESRASLFSRSMGLSGGALAGTALAAGIGYALYRALKERD